MGNVPAKGYPDAIGGRSRLWCGDHTGPVSYVVGGETIAASAGGAIQNSSTSIITGLSSIAALFPENISNSGNYEVKSVTVTTLGGTKQTGKLKWYFASGNGVVSVVIATAGSGQTNGTTTITDSGTNFTGTAAQVSITIAGGLITKATIINPGSGYFGAPTFTVAQGGTPGTLTGTEGAASDVEVAAGTNLSAETVRMLCIGG